MTKTLKISSLGVHKFLIVIIFLNIWLSDMPRIGEIYSTGKPVVLGIIVFCIILEIFLSKYRPSFLVVTVALLGLSIYSYFQSEILWIFYLVYLICFSRNISVEEYLSLIKRLYVVIFFVNIFVFLVTFLFFKESLVFVVSRGMIRYHINFPSPNAASEMLVSFVLLFFMNKKSKMDWIQILGFSVLGVFFYYFTKSATVFLILIIFAFDYFRDVLNVKKFTAAIVKWSIPFSCAFSIFSIYFLSNPLITVLDSFFTGRFNLAQKSLEYYGYSFWGQPVQLNRWALMDSGTYQLLTCDNTYIFMLVSLGLVFIPMLIIFNFRFVKQTDYCINVGLIVFALLTLIFYDALSPLTAFPLIVVAVNYFQLSKESKGKKEMTTEGLKWKTSL